LKGDKQFYGSTLNNLGRVYLDLGEKEQAQECFEQALLIRREV
jgi:tetratricopeptide (TPR) repeat protein